MAQADVDPGLRRKVRLPRRRQGQPGLLRLQARVPERQHQGRRRREAAQPRLGIPDGLQLRPAGGRTARIDPPGQRLVPQQRRGHQIDSLQAGPSVSKTARPTPWTGRRIQSLSSFLRAMLMVPSCI